MIIQTERTLFKKDEKNNKDYQGILKDFNNEYIVLQCEDEVKIDRKNIAQIKTIYNW